MRRLLYGLAALAVTVPLLFLALPRLIDSAALKPRIVSEFRKATGATLALDGDLVLDFLPVPRLAASDVRIREDGAVSDLVALKAFRARVELLPLFLGRLEISEIEVFEPRLEIDRASGDPSGGRTGEPAGFPEAADAVRIDRLRIVDGAVSYRDAAGASELADGISLEVSAGSFAGPFVLAGSMRVRERDVAVDGRVGRRVGGGSLPVSLRAVLAGGAAALSVQGRAELSGTAPRLEARARVEGTSLAALAAVFGEETEVRAGLDGSFGLSADMSADERGIGLAGLSVRVGRATASGHATYLFGPGGGLEVALGADRIDGSALFEGARPSRDRDSRENSGADSAVRFPTDFEADVRLTVGEIVLGKRSARDLRAEMSLRDGELSLGGFSVHLPGGALLELTGSAATRDGGLSYRGEASFRTDELKPLLAWLGADPGPTARNRLRTLWASAGISGDVSELLLTDVRGRLDASRFRGGATFALGRRPSFGASLGLDQIDLEGYLPDPGERPMPGNADGDGAAPKTVLPAALGDFDAGFALRIGILRHRGAVARGVRLDGTLREGVMTIRKASVRDLGGAGVRLEGVLSGLPETPKIAARLTAEADGSGGVLELLGFGPGDAPGPFRLAADIESAAEGIAVDAGLELAGGTLSASGTVPPLASLLGEGAGGAGTLRVKARHPDLARLAGRLDLGPIDGRTGEAGLDLVLESGAEGVGIRSETTLLGGSLRLAGRVRGPLRDPEFDVAADLRHPDLGLLVESLVPGWKAGDPGAASLGAAFRGNADGFEIEEMSGRIGGVEIAGEGSYRSASPRPRAELTLSAGVIVLGEAAEAGGGSDAGNARWSREVFRHGLPGGFDARIRLDAEALLHGSLRLDRPRVVAGIADGALSIESATGTMSGGEFRLSGVVEGGDVPAARISAALGGAGLSGPFPEPEEFGVSGRALDLTLDLEARGRSEAEIVRSLSGSGELSVRDGLIAGFDLGGIAGMLEDPDGPAVPEAAIETALGSGTTAFSSLGGSFAVRNGVFRFDGLGLEAPAATARVAGVLDLPLWRADLESEFRLRRPAGAPAFTMRLRGPPDGLRRVPDFKDLQVWALARGLDGMLRTPEPEPSPPRTPADPPPASGAEPETGSPPAEEESREDPETGEKEDGGGRFDPGSLVDGLLEGVR